MSQTLKLADDLFPGLFYGLKRATVRAGWRDIVPGPLTFESVSGKSGPITVTVTEVRRKLLSELTDEEARADGAVDTEDLAYALKRFYPDIGLDSPITVVLLSGPSVRKTSL